MTRKLKPDEITYVKKYWPNLNVDKILVSGEQTVKYNCMAWTLGIVNKWIWPTEGRDATKEELDTLYKKFGIGPSAGGNIAAFGTSRNVLGHVAISGQGHGVRWESKCGHWLRIQHGLGEMEGGAMEM
jgi:hypothetical protein